MRTYADRIKLHIHLITRRATHCLCHHEMKAATRGILNHQHIIDRSHDHEMVIDEGSKWGRAWKVLRTFPDLPSSFRAGSIANRDPAEVTVDSHGIAGLFNATMPRQKTAHGRHDQHPGRSVRGAQPA
ncbi:MULTISPECIES: hypothetical protein [unclassified Sphingobium]|uniref:hypothetical protein n=1 Tax=unclassified Sphingobium TaxID=2611147 RepID=UPI0011A0C844|nr:MULTISPECIES: hypothetical protein [unclassified Sphingobium]NML91436.1 hypothetical protein [Sphingobium sp. TB-6]